uniref:Nephrocystin 3-like N-terminal domain-containing protein n=1 Tax=Scophthalmus maximus TaxID=52904 RepID=A0A8D3A568_SCOMX
MAQTSLLQGKRFYCREWVFHKIQHCLQEKTSNLGGLTGAPGKQQQQQQSQSAAPGGGVSAAGSLAAGTAKSGGSSWGVLLVGGPGSGKTALCTELLWPTSAHGSHRALQQQGLAFHFCRADDADTLCAGGFVRGLVAQLCRSGLLPGYEEKVRDPAVQITLQPGECERNPTEAFKRCVLLPLLGVKPPQQSLFLLVDSIDEGCQLGEGEQRSPPGAPRTIAELLASHHEFLPPWLLLVCSARRQNKAITKLFTGEYRGHCPKLLRRGAVCENANVRRCCSGDSPEFLPIVLLV